MSPGTHTPLRLKRLPYPLSALQPVLSRDQVRVHHEQFQAGYVKRANALLGRAGAQGVDALPEDERLRFMFEWNGAVLHELFWEGITPGGSPPSDEFVRQVLGAPDVLHEIRGDLIATGLQVTGSGWSALSLSPVEGLTVHPVKNHDYPWQTGMRPLALLDVWEHAYVFDYLSGRREYLDRLSALIDWGKVEQRFQEAVR